jgi:protoporphyrinogen oxidase
MFIDLSAQFLASFYDQEMKLIQDLGLSDQMVKISDGTAVIKNEKSYALSPTGLVFGGLLPLMSKLRLGGVMLDVLLKSRELNVDQITKSTPLDDMSITQFAHKRMDQASLDYLLAPLFRGFFYWDTDSTTRAMLYFLLLDAATMKLFTLKQGIGTITKTIAQIVDTQVNAEAMKVAYDDESRLWKTAVTHQGHHETIESRAILCTTPAPYITPLFPMLPEAVQTYFNSIEYTANTTVHMFFNQDFSLPNFSHLFYPPRIEKDISALVLQSKKGAGTSLNKNSVISVFPSDSYSREIRDLSDDEINDIMLTHMDKTYPFAHLPLRGAFEFSKIVRLKQALPRFTPGYIRELVRYRADLVPSLPPGLFFAGDFLENAAMEGAIMSGELERPRIEAFFNQS